MKKYLLSGLALLAAISAFPQSTSIIKPRTAVNMADRIARKFAMYSEGSSDNQKPASGQPSILPEESAERSSQTFSNYVRVTNWTRITGSMNIYGVTVSDLKPLQYHDELNAITFVHRKSVTYQPSPAPSTTGSKTGVLVTMISTNLGATWDSTCVWNDDNNWARHPQGGLLSAPGNTSIASSTIVVTAPITQANSNLGWIGTAMGAKNVGPGTYNNTAASQTFVANSSPYGVLGRKVDFATSGFFSTDDGYVRALGLILDGSINATTAAGQAYRGARIVKGEFASGAVVFTHDSIIPDVRVSTVSGPLLSVSPGMAWSESGQIGYVYHFGSIGNSVPANSVGVNSGFQPIVWKTTDFGGSWQPIPQIDFNLPAFQNQVVDHVPATSSNTNVTIPSFNTSEGVGSVVDRNGKLHLVSLIAASFSPDADSSAFTTSFGNYDGERYNYLHVPGARPYLYDFTTDGTSGWSVTTIDSLGSEGPGTRPTDDGFSLNPWDPTGNPSPNKIEVDARVQVSRTPDGANLIYTWAETDSSITTGGNKKWNLHPNVHARLMRISSNGTQTLSPTELVVTRLKGSSGSTNPNVSNRGYNYYAAPRCKYDYNCGDTMVFILPMTVTNNNTLEQEIPVNHWYSNSNIGFFAPGTMSLTNNLCIPDGINKHDNIATRSVLYPNPASSKATLAIDLNNSSKVELTVMNVVGQTVRSVNAEGNVGANSINIDLGGLSKGIYLVNIKIDQAASTKKLVIE